MSPAVARAITAESPCSRCRRDAGERCRTASGRPARAPHSARVTHNLFRRIAGRAGSVGKNTPDTLATT